MQAAFFCASLRRGPPFLHDDPQEPRHWRRRPQTYRHPTCHQISKIPRLPRVPGTGHLIGGVSKPRLIFDCRQQAVEFAIFPLNVLLVSIAGETKEPLTRASMCQVMRNDSGLRDHSSGRKEEKGILI
jgi:hypothetical protein